MIEAAGLAGEMKTVVGEGVFNVLKPEGWTSHDVVAKLRGVLGVKRIGHAGTLDPSATGVLPILVGKGTRIAEFLFAWDKEYRAVLRIGETTDTQDATGTILQRRSIQQVTESDIRTAVAQFQGPIGQVPPMFSAIKVGGKPLYKAAREGRTVTRRERPVTIHRLNIVAISGKDVSLEISCSKGTYIRTLCADIGEVLGVGGHLASLERTRVGPLTVHTALPVQEVQRQFRNGTLGEHSMTLDQALASLPAIIVSEEQAARTLHGVPIAMQGIEYFDPLWKGWAGSVVRVKEKTGRLLALARVPLEYQFRRPIVGQQPEQTIPVIKVLVDP